LVHELFWWQFFLKARMKYRDTIYIVSNLIVFLLYIAKQTESNGKFHNAQFNTFGL